MSARNNESHEFYNWVNIMPSNCNLHPAFLNDDDKDMLKGSSILKHI